MANADAAIFYVMQDDWSQNWETPGQAKALEAAGTPTLVLFHQDYDVADPAALTAEIGRFPATLEVGAPA